jgi:preprotein translocase subunit SecG
MNGILSILIILSALLLMLVVLVQSPKGGGLGSSFGSTPSMMGGVRRTTEFLDKLTWGFAGALLVFVLLINMMQSGQTGDALPDSSVNEQIDANAGVPAQQPAPAAGDAGMPQSAPAGE